MSSGQDILPGHVPFSPLSLNVGTKAASGQPNPDSTGPAPLNSSRRFSTYAERTGTSPVHTYGVPASTSSPKTKKTGVETREELRHSSLSRSETTHTVESGLFPSENGESFLHQRASQGDLNQGASPFTVQFPQHTLVETLSSIQKSVHEDVRNVHIEVIRQAQMREMENLKITEEVQALRKENAELRQLVNSVLLHGAIL